jgi:hypothetical protein
MLKACLDYGLNFTDLTTLNKMTVKIFKTDNRLKLMRHIIVLTVVSLLGLTLMNSQPRKANQSDKICLDSLQKISDYILLHIDEMAPPGYKKQKEIRRNFQQKGYTNILYDVLNQDGLSALISFLKVNLHIEYSMNHKTYWIFPPIPRNGDPGIPFPDDWSFPPDPWRKK